MKKPKFVYVTYIRTTPKKLWQAVTEPKFTRHYWGGMANVSDWKKGSKWEHIAEKKNNEVWVAGKVLESIPPKRLVMTWFASRSSTATSRTIRLWQARLSGAGHSYSQA